MENVKMTNDLQNVIKSAEVILDELKGEKGVKAERMRAHARFIGAKTDVVIALLNGSGV